MYCITLFLNKMIIVVIIINMLLNECILLKCEMLKAYIKRNSLEIRSMSRLSTVKYDYTVRFFQNAP